MVDYGYIIYGSASKTFLSKLDTIQHQALRLCCGAVKTTPIPALQVEMEEMLLDMRRLQMAYWANLKGHDVNHLNQKLLEPCQEMENQQMRRFGWTIQERVTDVDIVDKVLSATVPISGTPPWIKEDAKVDLIRLDKGKGRIGVNDVGKYIKSNYSDHMEIYTDASKTESGRVGTAFIIPDRIYVLCKRITDNISVYTGELLVILLALKWVEEE